MGLDQAPLWEIPLTLGFTRRPFGLWAKIYDTGRTPLLRHLRIGGALEKVGIVKKVWLNFETQDSSSIMKFIEVLATTKIPCITFTVHSSSLEAGSGMYTKTKADERLMLRKVNKVLGRVRNHLDVTPSLTSEVAVVLERQYKIDETKKL